MKKCFKQAISLLMTVILLVTATTPFQSAFAVEEVIASGTNPDLEFVVENIVPSPASGFSPMSLIKGPLKMLAGRAWQELGAYAITNDTPGLSTFFKMLRTPADRAAAKERERVAQIVVDVAEIKASVARIESQLNDVSNRLDEYATAAAFNAAANKYSAIVDKYAGAWSQYETVLSKTKTLFEKMDELDALTAKSETLSVRKGELTALKATLEEQLAASTDAAQKAELQVQIDACDAELTTVEANILTVTGSIATKEGEIATLDASIESAMRLFIATVEQGSGLTFATDLSNITKAIWDTQNPGNSYLGAYEIYLRERFALEHEITPMLREAYESTVDAQLQILTIYTEYYTYKKAMSVGLYTEYSDDYFATIHEKIISNCNIIADVSDFDELMITEDYGEIQLAEFRINDPTFMPPENINQSVVIGGKTRTCYKVRDNKDKKHYIILKQFLESKDLVQKFVPDYAISSTSENNTLDYYNKHIYRPSMMFKHQYTDDGQYRMIEAANVPHFLADANLVRTDLRTTSKLTDISNATLYIPLYSNECVNHGHFGAWKDNVYWNMQFMDAEKAGNEERLSVSSVDVYEDSKYTKSIFVYRATETDNRYTDGTWQVIDSGEVNYMTVTVRDGQTLDLSRIEGVNIKEFNIIIIGKGKVVSNPNVVLENSQITLYDAENVVLENVNVVARNYQTAALRIQSSDGGTITFKGTNSFKGYAKTLTGLDIYEYYVPGIPLAASNGMYVAEGVNATLFTENATFQGAAGGAGICNDGTLTINGYADRATLIAKGSRLTNIDSEIDGDYNPRIIGAGIGVSFSGVADHGKINTDEFGCDVLGTKGVVRILSANVDASGAESNLKGLYSEDIGGVYFKGGSFSTKGGSINSCTVKTKYQRIDSGIQTTHANNVFKPDVYTVSTYTKGTNGVTSDGVYFKVIGENGTETDWMYASDIGDDKGDETQKITGNSVGKIKEIQVKTEASNHWYPAKITVSNQYDGESVTVYGGRWIGTSATTLSPDDNIYKVTVNTGTESNAGTDADISLYLQDGNGRKTETVALSDIHQDSNAFEKNDTDDFWIYAPDGFGDCQHAFFTSDYKNPAAGWLLDSFTITKVQGESNIGEGYTFYSGQWFEEARTIGFGKKTGQTGAFYVEVKTSNVKRAGTDSDIYLTIYGDKGNTGEINLGTYAGSGNNFEKNDLDCFHIGYNTKGIGKINKIVIYKNNDGAGADWHLDYIKITEEVSKDEKAQCVTFNIDSWIEEETRTFDSKYITDSTLKSDGFIDRDILAGLKQNEDGSYTVEVDRTVTMTHELFDLLKESDTVLTVKMMSDNGDTIYEVTFDGSQIDNHHAVLLQNGYSLSDGEAIVGFLTRSALPAGTTVKINAAFLGFAVSDTYIELERGVDTVWKAKSRIVKKDGVTVFPTEQNAKLLVQKLAEMLPLDPKVYDEICVWVEESEGGKTTVSTDIPEPGDAVIIVPKPSKGKTVDTVSVMDLNGNAVAVTVRKDGTYMYTQPEGEVTVKVTYRDLDPHNPQTGVTDYTWLWLTLMAFSGGMFLLLLANGRKKHAVKR